MSIPKDVIEGSLIYHLNIPLEHFKNPGFHPAFNTVLNQWSLAQEWVVKSLWDSKYKINAPNKVKNAFKLRSEVLIKAYYLCERCHSWQSELDFDIPYKSAGYWFGRVKIDFLGLEIDTLINQPSAINGNIKRGLLEVEQERLRQFKKWDNPYKNTNAIGLELLIQCALILANKSNQFDKTHWKPFLKAYTNNLKDMQTNPIWGVGYIKAGKYYRQGGRGRGGEVRWCYGDVTNFQTFDIQAFQK